MVARLTQPCFSSSRTNAAAGGGFGIDPADQLYAAVKAFNTRQGGKAYEPGAPEGLFEAVRAFNARQTTRLA